MSATADAILVERCQLLRLRMTTQRQLIAYRLAPLAGSDATYPRSVTMRLLMRHPALVARLAMALLKLLRNR